MQQSNIDVNRRNNDRLTSFMLAMQGGPLIGPIDTSWSGWESCNNTHDKLRRLMDLPASIGKKACPKKIEQVHLKYVLAVFEPLIIATPFFCLNSTEILICPH